MNDFDFWLGYALLFALILYLVYKVDKKIGDKNDIQRVDRFDDLPD